jgi:hypothetical protein
MLGGPQIEPTGKVRKLREALQTLVDDVLEYERANNLAPNPGRLFCWDSVEQAMSVLEQTK